MEQRRYPGRRASKTRVRQQRSQVDELKQTIADNGGDRLERLAHDIRQDELERAPRQGTPLRRAYRTLGDATGRLTKAPFSPSATAWPCAADTSRQREAELQNRLTERSVDFAQGKMEHDKLSAEIRSLKARRSNIPADQIALRTRTVSAP